MFNALRRFVEYGSCPITNSTDICLSKCEEDGQFKGFYLTKKFTISDSVEAGKQVKVFAKGAFRIDSIEQLKKVRELFDKAINEN